MIVLFLLSPVTSHLEESRQSEGVHMAEEEEEKKPEEPLHHGQVLNPRPQSHKLSAISARP